MMGSKEADSQSRNSMPFPKDKYGLLATFGFAEHFTYAGRQMKESMVNISFVCSIAICSVWPLRARSTRFTPSWLVSILTESGSKKWIMDEVSFSGTYLALGIAVSSVDEKTDGYQGYSATPRLFLGR